MKTSYLEEAVAKLKQGKVYVIGDIILDHYLMSESNRLSPEAPVPVVKVLEEKYTLGGASNVAHQIAKLGAKAFLIGRVGHDKDADTLKTLLAKNAIQANLIVDPSITTIKKTRVLVGNHHIVRIDWEKTEPVGKKIETKILDLIKKIPPESIIIVSDYNKGLITESVSRTITEKARERNLQILVDPTPHTLQKIFSPFLIKPNRKEAEQISGQTIKKDWSNLKTVAKTIQKMTSAEKVLITLGQDGMAFFENNKLTRFPTFVRKVYDVSGAGDTVIAVLATALSVSTLMKDALFISGVAAGLVVEKPGTATCSREEILEFAKTHLSSEK